MVNKDKLKITMTKKNKFEFIIKKKNPNKVNLRSLHMLFVIRMEIFKKVSTKCDISV